MFGADTRSEWWWSGNECFHLSHPEAHTRPRCNSQTHPQEWQHTRTYARLQRTKNPRRVCARGESWRRQEASGSYGGVTKPLCLSQHPEPKTVSPQVFVCYIFLFFCNIVADLFSALCGKENLTKTWSRCPVGLGDWSTCLKCLMTWSAEMTGKTSVEIKVLTTWHLWI